LKGDGQALPTGISRFRSGFPIPPDSDFISLGEGNTPLVRGNQPGSDVFYKCEQFNPTGSFKDRGTAVLVSALAAAGIREAVEDSSGNAGSSFAAYAARAGIRARIFLPRSASGPKRAQISAYGADVVEVPGSRSEAARRAFEAAEGGCVYASHAYLPHGYSGIATMAFEIVEQLGREPGAVVVPVGQGSLVLGLCMGFRALRNAGMLMGIPSMIGVQAQACAPLFHRFYGQRSDGDELESTTSADGIRIARPLRGEAVIRAVGDSGGRMLAVSEAEIQDARDALGREGLYVEATSAVVQAAIRQVGDMLTGPIVAVLSGSGYKSDPGMFK
jgi:threonine synthase